MEVVVVMVALDIGSEGGFGELEGDTSSGGAGLVWPLGNGGFGGEDGKGDNLR